MREVTLEMTVFEGADDWIVRCRSPHGSARVHVPSPFEGDDLVGALHDLELALTRSHSPVVTRRAEPPERTALRFGEQLAEVLKAPQMQVILDRCRAQARRDHGTVRILLSTDGPHVSQIPWEFAMEPQVRDFVALRLSVARYLDVAEPMPALDVALPLRVLGVQATPEDSDPLEASAERERIERAFAHIGSDRVEVTWLPDDRWRTLQRALDEEDWHALHFIGHGGFDREIDSGFVELSDDEGRAKRIYAGDLARALGNEPTLRLVVLNACESASGGGGDTFAGTAATVMREGIPAVIAMQYEITDEAALTFASAFYEQVALGAPVDLAMTKARVAVKVEHRSLEWATPVLYLASEEAHLFNVGGPPRVEVPRPEPEPEPEPVPEPVTEVERAPEPTVETAPAPDAGLRETARDEGLGPVDRACAGPGEQVAGLRPDGSVAVWSRRRRELVATCRAPNGAPARHVSWTRWPKHLATAHSDGTVAVWDLDDGSTVCTISTALRGIRSLAVSHDGASIAVTGEDRRIRIFDATGRPVSSWLLGAAKVQSLMARGPRPLLVRFAPDDQQVVVASDDGKVRRLDLGGRELACWAHEAAAVDLDLGEHGLVSALPDGRVRAWRWDGRVVLHGDPRRPADHVAIDAEGYVAAASQGGWCYCYPPGGGPPAGAEVAGRAVGVALTPAGIVTVTGDGVVQTWARPTSQAGPR